MAFSTGTGTIAQMLEDLVQDLIPYTLDKTLLTNQAIVARQINVEGQGGSQVRIPVATIPTDAATVNEGASIIGQAEGNLTPIAANIDFVKRGVGSNVTSESVEEGMYEHVVGATLDRLSGVLSTATDIAGFTTMKTDFTNDDGTGGANAQSKHSFVFSPSGVAFAQARAPMVNHFFDNDLDQHNFRASCRNGFATLGTPANTVGRTITSRILGSATATAANVEALATSVANLRQDSALVGLDGNYVAVVDSGYELDLNKQIAALGGTTIGSLSDVGNNALRNAIFSVLAGATLYRSNLLPFAS